MLRSVTVIESGYYVYYFKPTKIKLSAKFTLESSAKSEVASCMNNGIYAEWIWMDANTCLEGTDSFDVRVITSSQPSPYSSSVPVNLPTPQLTFKALDPTQTFENIACSCGPKFAEDPHEKKCGMKDKAPTP